METGLRVQMGVNRGLEKAASHSTSSGRSVAQGRLSPLRFIFVISLSVLLCPGVPANAQSPSGTVRHHRVEEQDPTADLLTQAETALGKQDYATAEPLLRKYLETYPDSYAGWYDLGYVYRGLGRRDDSIAAYRRSVAAKADVFESNLNLGLVLADTANPEAEQFLRA